MKYLERNLQGLRIIYLHNPYECSDCSKEINNLTFPKTRKSKESISRRNDISPKKPVENSTLNKKAVKDHEFKYPSPVKHTPVKSVKKADKSDDFSEPKKFKPLSLFSGKNKQAKVLSKLVKKTSEGKSSSSSSTKNVCNTPQKASGTKVPGKGTLKRKRWLLDALNHKNDNYEDDMFEDQEFSHFQEFFDSESDNAEKYEDLQTPVFPFSLSPRETSPTPSDKDCFNPEELKLSRKRAEEYQYRRMKRKKLSSSPEKEKKKVAPTVDSQKKTEDVLKRLEEVADLLNLHKRQNEKSSDNEDDYFSDSPPDSCSVNV